MTEENIRLDSGSQTGVRGPLGVPEKVLGGPRYNEFVCSILHSLYEGYFNYFGYQW